MKNLLKDFDHLKRTQDDEKNILFKKIELKDILIRKMEQQFIDLKRNSTVETGGFMRVNMNKPPGTAPNTQSHTRSSLLLSNKDYVTLFDNLTGKGVKATKDPNANILSHKLIQAYQKNQNDSKATDYKMSRMKIQVTQKSKDVYKLEKRAKEFKKTIFLDF